MKQLTERQRHTKQLHMGVIALYKTGEYTTEQIARNYSISPRQVQRIAKQYGVIRTLAEGNRTAAPHKHYHKLPKELKVQRKHLTRKKRYSVISGHPYCVNCGMRPDDGARLEVDHIDNNPTNNEDSNLQVLCQPCNIGKSHLDRYGE